MHAHTHIHTHAPSTVKFSLIRCTDKPEVRKGYKWPKLLLPNIWNRFSKTRNPYLENHGRERRTSHRQTDRQTDRKYSFILYRLTTKDEDIFMFESLSLSLSFTEYFKLFLQSYLSSCYLFLLIM